MKRLLILIAAGALLLCAASALADYHVTGPGGQEYARTVVISPVPGDDSASGQALRDALGAITDAAADNRWLIKLEPGVFNLGSVSLVMKEYVDIEGSSWDGTRIVGTGMQLIWGAGNCELRDLKLICANSSGHATGVNCTSGCPNMHRVELQVSGVSDGTSTSGLYMNTCPGEPLIFDSIISVHCENSLAFAAYVIDSSLVARRCSLSATTNTVGAYAAGLYVKSGGRADIGGCTVQASGTGSSSSYGVLASNNGTEVRVQNCSISAKFAGVQATPSGETPSLYLHNSKVEASDVSGRGIQLVGFSQAYVQASIISAPDGYPLLLGEDVDVTVATSQVEGVVSGEYAGLTCVKCYNENLTELNAKCRTP